MSNLNINAIKTLLSTIEQAKKSGQKELRLPITQADQIGSALTNVLLMLTDVQDRLIKVQDNAMVGSVNIELKGDKF
jgi:hypothetical protein